jgi:N-acetylmuramoyl-L-alanine amidase
MRVRLVLVGALMTLAVPAFAQPATSPAAAYEAALTRERALASRPASQSAAAREVRALIAAYQDVVHRWPQSGYADNALWQAAGLAEALYHRTGQPGDRRAAIRMLELLVKGYPSSSLRRQAQVTLAELKETVAPPVPRPHPQPRTVRQAAAGGPQRDSAAAPAPARETAPRDQGSIATAAPNPISSQGLVATTAASPPGSPDTVATTLSYPPAQPGIARLAAVRRVVLPDVVRITLELDREVPFSYERLEGPPRVFFDLSRTTAAEDIGNRTLSFHDDVVRKVRLGRQENQTTRVVLDLAGVSRYSVFTLYNPFRVIVDVERQSPQGLQTAGLLSGAPVVGTATPTFAASALVAVPPGPMLAALPAGTAGSTAAAPGTPASPGASPPPGDPAPEPLTATSRPPVSLPGPQAPAANSRGGYSIARQLGLGVSRIVIDPGHGGHDPGALGRRISEAELVLDVALRLEKLLVTQPGFEVVLTRRTDVFVPLEERTAIANREGADLFLSIHANASRNPQARGVETYFLNFARDPEAAAVAARENSASARAMHHLPDIVKAIALTNKLDESRDFAQMVQQSMVERLRANNKDVRDLGVKQAPFVVLIGAAMPSVLAEISFVTHAAEGQLLRTPAYRQRIAEALHHAVVQYQLSLKSVGTLASHDEE